MRNTPTEVEKRVLCSRCGKVANPNDSWENSWPNYGHITLGASSVIHWALLRKVARKRPSDDNYKKQKIVRAVTNGEHPAINDFSYQQIAIEWAGYDRYPVGMNTEYRLCCDCQHKLIEIIGKFFFKNIPEKQPIKYSPKNTE